MRLDAVREGESKGGDPGEDGEEAEGTVGGVLVALSHL